MNLTSLLVAVVAGAALYFTIRFYGRAAARAVNPAYKPQFPFWKRLPEQLRALNASERRTLMGLLVILALSLVWVAWNAIR